MAKAKQDDFIKITLRKTDGSKYSAYVSKEDCTKIMNHGSTDVKSAVWNDVIKAMSNPILVADPQPAGLRMDSYIDGLVPVGGKETKPLDRNHTEAVKPTYNCTWKQRPSGEWEIGCKNACIACGPTEDMEFCPKCGKAIIAMPYRESVSADTKPTDNPEDVLASLIYDCTPCDPDDSRIAATEVLKKFRDEPRQFMTSNQVIRYNTIDVTKIAEAQDKMIANLKQELQQCLAEKVELQKDKQTLYNQVDDLQDNLQGSEARVEELEASIAQTYEELDGGTETLKQAAIMTRSRADEAERNLDLAVGNIKNVRDERDVLARGLKDEQATNMKYRNRIMELNAIVNTSKPNAEQCQKPVIVMPSQRVMKEPIDGVRNVYLYNEIHQAIFEAGATITGSKQ